MTQTIIKPSASKALLIDGKAASTAVLERVAAEASGLPIKPGLAVILVGEDPASQVYVKSKSKAAHSCGFHSVQHDLPVSTSQSELIGLVQTLNADPEIHGILVQLPLPAGIDSTKVLETIAPEKDVDGFHPVNVGLLATGLVERALVPCTPAGVMRLLAHVGASLRGARALVLGRSVLVGKPMAALLTNADATVTVAHSRTRDLAAECRRAEVLVAAAGRAEMVRGDWVANDAVVIDVGINRLPDGRLVGDCATAECAAHAAAITPVPGGVGPMTIACLLDNTVTAALARRG